MQTRAHTASTRETCSASGQSMMSLSVVGSVREWFGMALAGWTPAKSRQLLPHLVARAWATSRADVFTRATSPKMSLAKRSLRLE